MDFFTALLWHGFLTYLVENTLFLLTCCPISEDFNYTQNPQSCESITPIPSPTHIYKEMNVRCFIV